MKGIIVCRQNALTLSLKIVQESDFSDMAYNSAYVSDVQSLIAKSTLPLNMGNFVEFTRIRRQPVTV